MKKLLFLMLFISCATFVFSQVKPRLGILPFAGGVENEGESIATLFSLEREIQNAFTIVPRTSAVNALVAEHNFQMRGYTDSDTIARLGHLLNADFVVSGHIRRLGNSNLVIVTIVNVETFEQMAGDYRVYKNIEEIRRLLPQMTQKMIAASQRDTSRIPKLAIAPFRIANIGVNMQDAETLAQILAVEITNTGKYAVLPRTTTMETALKELEFQTQGYTAEEGAKALGRATNADFVLSAEVRNLGTINMFIAQMLHVEDGRLIVSGSQDYQIVDEGIQLMENLALLLTYPEDAEARISVRNRERSRTATWGDPAKLWSLGISAGTSFTAPWLIGTVHGTIAPLRYSFLRIGLDLGMISGIKDVDYYSLYPFIHYNLFLPFSNKGSWYIGAGGGYLMAELTYPEGKVALNLFALDLITGVNIGDALDISYTFRTDFDTVSHKLAVGYVYRLKKE